MTSWRIFAWFALAGAAACSPANAQSIPGGDNGPSGTPAGTCASGACGACGGCLDACLCMTHGDDACASACAGDTGTPPVAPGDPGAGQSVCGDGVCDPVTEDCVTCAADCGACPSQGSGGNSGSGAGGSSGSGAGGSGFGGSSGSGAGGSGSGGSGAGGSGSGGSGGTGTAGTGGSGGTGTAGSGAGGSAGTGYDAVHQAAIDRAKSGVGFSYWWGHGRFLPTGPTASNAGSCSGSCPSCTHGGSYGGDCSGFVAKVWVVPSSNSDMTADSHPYSTLDFDSDTSQWSTVPQGSMQVADAMVYRSGGAGHIFIYESGDPWGSMYVYECKGCSYGCVADMRTASSAYHAIRRTGY